MTKPFNPWSWWPGEGPAAPLHPLQRAGKGSAGEIIDFNGLVINRSTHECWLYDRPLSLTPIEFDILWMLCENRGQVISAERLFETVWGEKYLDRNNTVMVHIRRLREKMASPPATPRFIKTVWAWATRWTDFSGKKPQKKVDNHGLSGILILALFDRTIWRHSSVG